MKFSVFKKLLSFTFLFLSYSLYASSTQPDHHNFERCLKIFDQKLKDYNFLPKEHGIGVRGHVGLFFTVKLEDVPRLKTEGLMNWESWISPIKSFEEALEDDKMKEDFNRMVKRIYYISKKNFEENKIEEIIEDFVSQEKPDIFWIDNGQKIQITQEEYESQLRHKGLLKTKEFMGEKLLFIDSWAIPKNKGVIRFEAIASSKSIVKDAKKLYELGFKFKFNHNLEQSALYLKNQNRTFFNKETQQRESLGESGGRYADNNGKESPSMQIYKKAIELGQAVTVEIYDPNGVFVAGNNGFYVNGRFYGDSVYYNQDWEAPEYLLDGQKLDIPSRLKKSPNIRKTAEYVLAHRLNKFGIDMYDIGMITNYGNDVKAQVIPIDQYIYEISERNDVEVDFSTDWSPID
ncbi:MAG: hypothetical protein H6622_05165 [Halobacteriovoraceae bacterium]|nr:hypothetical protein [Halobacteriovoraceae bacterium]